MTINNQRPGTLAIDDNRTKGRFLHKPDDHAGHLRCLCDFTRETGEPGVPLEDALVRAVKLVSSSLRFPENTCVRVTLGNSGYKTRNFRETRRMISADIYVNGKKDGAIDACLLEEIPEAGEEPFTPDEHNLIEALSRQLGTIIEYRQAMEELLTMNRKLERYAHAVSHDLKGPLSAINLAITVLDEQLSRQQESDVSAVCSELLNVIISSVKKAIRMTNDLLPTPPDPPILSADFSPHR